MCPTLERWFEEELTFIFLSKTRFRVKDSIDVVGRVGINQDRLHMDKHLFTNSMVL